MTENLNPRYKLLSYDINLMKNTIRTIDAEELLKTCPQTIIIPNTLFYHFDDDNHDINTQPKFTNKEFYFNFLKTIDLSHGQVLWNDQPLQLLDLTLISVELGFNPTMFYYQLKHERLKNITNSIIDYCKINKLDGYITYNIKDITEGHAHEQCASYFKNTSTSLCPTIYLLKNPLKVLSTIELNKVGKRMNQSELMQLHNNVFCNMSNILSVTLGNEVIVDIVVDTILLETSAAQSRNIVIYGDVTYTVSDFFNLVPTKLYSLLNINSSDLYNECDYEYYSNIVNDPPIRPDHLKVDILTYHLNNIVYQSDKLFDLTLSSIAKTFNLTAFIYVHYDVLNKLPLLQKYTSDLIAGHTMDEIKTTITNMEEIIVSQLFLNYKNSLKGLRANISFVNLEYIKTTYRYLINHIMAILMIKDIKEAIGIIEGKNDETIVKYFNADYLYNKIIADQYENATLLYQDLLMDVSLYTKEPTIHLKYLEMIADLSGNSQSVANFLIQTEVDIYQFYRLFIGGERLFANLYDKLGVQLILTFLNNFATQHQLNPSIVLRYHDITLLSGMENFAEIEDQMMQENPFEFYKTKLQEIKSKILVMKFITILSNLLNIKLDNPDTRSYLIHQVDKLIDQHDEIKLAVHDIGVDWYQWATVYDDDQNQKLYDLFLQNNTNEELLSFIYHYLEKDLSPQTKMDILQLIRQKQLLPIWLSYLNGEISKDALGNTVLVKLADVANKQSKDKKRSKTEDDDRSQEESEERSTKSKSKRTRPVEESEAKQSIEREEAKRKSMERREQEKLEQERIEREEAKQKRIERREQEKLEQEEKEQKERERTERQEKRRLEKEQKEAEAEDLRQARKIAKQEALERERAKRIEQENDTDEDPNEDGNDESNEETQSM